MRGARFSSFSSFPRSFCRSVEKWSTREEEEEEEVYYGIFGSFFGDWPLSLSLGEKIGVLLFRNGGEVIDTGRLET